MCNTLATSEKRSPLNSGQRTHVQESFSLWLPGYIAQMCRYAKLIHWLVICISTDKWGSKNDHCRLLVLLFFILAAIKAGPLYYRKKRGWRQIQLTALGVKNALPAAMNIHKMTTVMTATMWMTSLYNAVSYKIRVCIQHCRFLAECSIKG